MPTCCRRGVRWRRHLVSPWRAYSCRLSQTRWPLAVLRRYSCRGVSLASLCLFIVQCLGLASVRLCLSCGSAKSAHGGGAALRACSPSRLKFCQSNPLSMQVHRARMLVDGQVTEVAVKVRCFGCCLLLLHIALICWVAARHCNSFCGAAHSPQLS